ncbi:MAG: hypothetical protein HY420_01310 [Candidatus Kerfeldbacteria bacterium]|nr:hypothetical protein [Candidatus Kerfeldbacteria bacterium]
MQVSWKSAELFLTECEFLTPTDQQICRERLDALRGDSPDDAVDLEELVEVVFKGYPDVGEYAVATDWDQLDMMADEDVSQAIISASRAG